MTSLTFLTVVAVDPITRTKKAVLMDRTPLTNEWTDRCVRSGHLAVTLHSQSSRKKRRDWSWKCKHRLKWRISIIVMEFFGDPIVPDGKISGTARSLYGTAGYIRKDYLTIIIHPWDILYWWEIIFLLNLCPVSLLTRLDECIHWPEWVSYNWHSQDWFWACAQVMRDVVTK